MTSQHAAYEPASLDDWMIVELLGHRRLAGRVSEVTVAGHGFLRLDIPPAGADPGRTQFIAPSAVYALHPVDETTARTAATTWRPEPVSRWELRPAPPTRRDVDDAITQLIDEDTEEFDDGDLDDDDEL